MNAKPCVSIMHVLLLVAVTLGSACATQSPSPEAESEPEMGVEETMAGDREASIARTRDQVRMLDDLYKTAVVLVTTHYVNTPDTFSGASLAKNLFGAMEQNGWHQVRLLGLTDDLVNADNAPADAFENAAAERLLAGEPFHEEVVMDGGTEYLRYATPIPVVLEKCVMCHPTFEGNDGNVGALSYRVALIE